MKEQLGDRAGLIEIDVFAEGEVAQEEVAISARGLPPSKEKQSRGSYRVLRTTLLKISKTSPRNAVEPGSKSISGRANGPTRSLRGLT